MLSAREQARLLRMTCETDAAAHRLVWKELEQQRGRLEWALRALDDGLPTRTEEEVELALETVRAELQARRARAEWMNLEWRDALNANRGKVGAAEATDDWLAHTRGRRETLLEAVREEPQEGPLTLSAELAEALLSVLDGLALLESDCYGGEDGEAAEAEDAQE